MRYYLYNNDKEVAWFQYIAGTITKFKPLRPELLPMQIKNASADAFALWLQGRAIDMNVAKHRSLVNKLLGSRDKIALSIATHMFSISDAFTCFEKKAFIKREELCLPEDQNSVSDYILISSDTTFRKTGIATPNVSTDGSFLKTWRYEHNAWWLYKIQNREATISEHDIARALRRCKWPAAIYQYDKSSRTRIKTKNFVGSEEFFEPYESLRYMFENRADNEKVIYKNIASLGENFEKDYRRILIADALFMNSDRHMRNFGVLRSTQTGELLRMAPNFDNNQAYKSTPGVSYSGAQLYDFVECYGWRADDASDLETLLNACEGIPYLADCLRVGRAFLLTM